jgi:hypothetical protein
MKSVNRLRTEAAPVYDPSARPTGESCGLVHVGSACSAKGAAHRPFGVPFGLSGAIVSKARIIRCGSRRAAPSHASDSHSLQVIAAMTCSSAHRVHAAEPDQAHSLRTKLRTSKTSTGRLNFCLSPRSVVSLRSSWLARGPTRAAQKTPGAVMIGVLARTWGSTPCSVLARCASMPQDLESSRSVAVPIWRTR